MFRVVYFRAPQEKTILDMSLTERWGDVQKTALNMSSAERRADVQSGLLQSPPIETFSGQEFSRVPS